MEITKRIILASQSPRRRELFGQLGLPFEVLVSDAEETITSSEPSFVTEELSKQKAEVVAQGIEDGIIVGADTVVSVDGEILGKPVDRADAKRMIQSLQGRSHMVYTGVTIICKEKGKTVQERTFSEGTKVYVASMNEEEIAAYIDTKEPYDKAGAYGIQGIFSKHIKKIEGDYFNVVGLPVHRLYEEMKPAKLISKSS